VVSHFADWQGRIAHRLVALSSPDVLFSHSRRVLFVPWLAVWRMQMPMTRKWTEGRLTFTVTEMAWWDR
jgi:hypothetical protein